MALLLYNQHLHPFSQRLGLAMQAAKFSQNDLACVTQRSQSLISRWLNGKREPGIQDVAVCAEVLNVSTDFLLGVVSVDELDKRRLSNGDVNLDAIMSTTKLRRRK